MLTLKTLRGAGWSVAARTSSRVIDLATLLLLARMLTPADFGLTAIAVSLVAIVEMVLEVPLVQALMRLQKIEKSHLDTAFTLGLLRGGVIAVLMMLAAWPVAHIYDDPRLVPLILVLALGPIARSLYSPTMVHFFRDLDFRVSFVADFSGKVIAALLSLAVLYAGGGYWALVINPVVSSLMPTILSYVLAPYSPRLSLERLRDFSAFTGWFTSSQVLAAFSWQYDRVFLGYNVEKAVLGRYSLASDFSVMPTQSLIGPAMRPVMAAFATMADDRKRLHLSFLKAARLTMFIALPAGIGIALTSDQIVEVFLGSQWSSASVYLRWLSLAVMLTAYYQPVSSLCVAIDQPNLLLKINILETVTKLPLLTVAFYTGGLLLMLYARVVAAALHFLISAVYARRVIGTSLTAQMRNLWQVAVSCIAMALAVLLLENLLQRFAIPSIMQLVAMSACGAVVYAASMHLCGFRLRALRQ
ncbi:PST family polysaccharide transporter [Methylobacterium brachiatum]|uniref:PST family polysaccharide transporter n=1 Tax=Methylobacterium brachiatum TaxID=269660 RepID=A0AAJ1WVF9_9HYPH|nr:lipopolysaccharide biosynthesis protein [Methylobacterium brachiatum]MCB4801839.1 lipopolysaccharide biosynthesis protein [Methylobacterium brachiatum]MDQ0542175.1 PST family polysaccharide transporter [Methylobacterium brachiatum]